MSKNGKNGVNGKNGNSADGWTDGRAPRISIGGEEGQTTQFEGVYLSSERITIKGRPVQVHRFRVDGGDEVEVWGSGAINHRLARLPEETPVRMSYVGTKELEDGRTMKDISVLWPKGTKLRPAEVPF